MVKERKRAGCGDPTVNRIFNDPAIGFRAVDAHVKKVFYKQHIEPLEATFKWMMGQKEIAKRIVCEESGREVLPKTPSRNNPLALVTPSLAALKSDFMVDEVSGFTNEEGSHRDTCSHTAVRTQNVPKAQNPQFIPKDIKQEVMSPGSSHRLRSPQIMRSRDPISRTPACASRGHPTKVKQDGDAGSEDLFGSGETNKAPTPKKTPGSPSRFLQQSVRRPPPSPYVDAVKAVFAKQQDEIRKAPSPGRLGAHVTQPTTHQSSPVKMTRKSELVRKMEGKVKAVISNKDEIMRERSERAKREREERMRRVQYNNRKKEEEQAARMAIIRKREQEIEELRKQYGSPSKGHTRMMSATKTPPRSASRPHGWTGGETLSRCSPQKPIRNAPDKDAFMNEMAPRTPESPSIAEASSHCKGARDTLDFSRTYKPMRNEIVLPEVEVSMSNACEAEDDCVTSSNDVLTQLYSESLHEGKEQVVDGEDQGDRVVEKTETSVAQVDLMETAAGHELDERHEIILGEEDGGEEQPQREERGEGNAEVDEEEQMKEARRETGEGEKEVHTDKENIDVSNYEVTPEKKPLPSTEDNYNIEDLSSGDETDDEDQPRKAIPLWARPENLRRALREQRMHPPIDVDAFFGPVVVPDLQELFPSSKTRYRQRTSSANWSSPLSNPTKGTSKYFSSQRGER